MHTILLFQFNVTVLSLMLILCMQHHNAYVGCQRDVCFVLMQLECFVVNDGDQIKIWRIPQDGIVEDLCECSAELSGHTKRLGHCEWHPTADNILLSVAYDLKVTT